MLQKLVLAAALFTSVGVMAADTTKETHSDIKNTFSQFGIETKSVDSSPIAGLQQVVTSKGVFYVSPDGRYLVDGSIIDTKTRTDIKEGVLTDIRLEGLNEYKDSTIVYQAKDEKYKVTVFTDITCGYCRKLHKEMQAYNDLGITVQYMAFPRGGTRSNSFTDMEKIWCSDNKQQAMDLAKNQGTVNNGKSMICKAPVAEHYNLGQQFGVTGTPAMVFENGTMQTGYQEPQQLLATLQKLDKAS